jgi:hypothetical protein
MDAILIGGQSAGLGYDDIRASLRRLGVERSPDTIRDRARALGLRATSGVDEPGCDIRREDGADALLIALQATHTAPPADTVPSPQDGRRFDWRRLTAPAGAAGSPGALCADLGERTCR